MPGRSLALLVDSDADTRQMYAECLRQSTFEIDEAEDGREALAKAISRLPEVIVTGIQLPGMNGVDLCRLLRYDALTRAIPIIVVTGDARSHVKLAEAAGADAVLVQPCPPERLAAEIRRVLAASTALPATEHPLHDNAGREPEKSDELSNRSRATVRRMARSRTYERRDTTEPPASPPEPSCPACDRPLYYLQSHIGGVSERHAEQWDYFECSACRGLFEYRQRTAKLRAFPPDEPRISRRRS
jgi:CheY-like chemotaxis protein